MKISSMPETTITADVEAGSITILQTSHGEDQVVYFPPEMVATIIRGIEAANAELVAVIG